MPTVPPSWTKLGLAPTSREPSSHADLVGVDIWLNFACLHSVAGGAGQARDPVAAFSTTASLIRPGLLSNSAKVASKKQPPGKTPRLKYERNELHIAHTRPSAGGRLETWLEDLFGEDPAGLLDSRKLQLLFRSKVGEQATLLIPRSPARR